MQVTEKGSLKQMCKSSGGQWGGETVNSEFWSLMRKVFSSDLMEQFKLGHKADYLEIDADFESKKRNLAEYKAIQIRLPASLIEMTMERYGKSVEDLIVAKEMTHEVSMRAKDRISISMETIQKLFQTALVRLLAEMETLVRKDTDIIMVGGFSGSPVVQREVRQKYPGNRVIIPSESELAVLKGAVYYGHNPESISSRVCKFTYGLEVQRYFLQGDPEELKTMIHGQPYCTKVFARVVTIGEEIGIGESRYSDDISPMKPGAQTMKFEIFKSTEESPMYVTDPSCLRIGTIKVNMTSVNHSVRIWMKFGETELIVEGRDAVTQNLVPGAVNLDLLASSS